MRVDNIDPRYIPLINRAREDGMLFSVRVPDGRIYVTGTTALAREMGVTIH